MLDQLNEKLISEKQSPVAFDHDCREGICGSCSLYINGRAHGPQTRTTTCQLHMRSFNNGDTIFIEPWRSKAFPIIKDLIVDRSAFDRIQQSGGFDLSIPRVIPWMRMQFQFLKKMPIVLLMQLHVLVVGHALRAVKMFCNVIVGAKVSQYAFCLKVSRDKNRVQNIGEADG